MASERTVRDAEMAVAQRKLLIARQWSGLRQRSIDAVVSPTSLGALALAGAMFGWRSAGKHKNQGDGGGRRAEASAEHPAAARPSIVDGALRSVGVGVLRGFASMAIEELLRGSYSKAEKPSPTGAASADVESGEVSDSPE
jgi:hypothetical protein